MSSQKTAFLFPGQGAQAVGMGEEFFNAVPEAAEIFDAAESVTGIPVKELCFKGPAEELVKTANLQPCLTTVEMACAAAAKNKGIKPNATAGHSLGEYPALWLSGILDTETAIHLVHQRGRLMDQASEESPGAMAAVIGIPREELEAMADSCRKPGEVLSLANHNSPEQIVITGEKKPVGRLCKLAKERKARAIPLKVSGGYHSALMKKAADEFAKVVKDAVFSSPSIPIYSNVTGKAETDPEKIKELMVEQICSPVRWVDIMNSMADDGITRFIEAGPGKVLTNLGRKCLPGRDVTFCRFDNPATLDDCLNS